MFTGEEEMKGFGMVSKMGENFMFALATRG